MSGRISREEVKRIAGLARLALSDDDIETMRGELDAILDWMAALASVDTTDVPPTFHAVDLVAPLRSDEPGASLRHSEALRAAARSEAGAFAVPKVMEGE